MKRFLGCSSFLYVASLLLLAQAQPPQTKAPENQLPKNNNHSASNQATVPRPPVQQHNFAASPSKSHNHTPTTADGSYHYTGSGHYYNPVSSGDMHYYSPTTNNGGYWYAGKGQYYSGNEHYYNPVNSGDMHYSSPTGSWYSGDGQYYSSRGSYYTSSNTAYTSAQGQYTSLGGNYYTPRNLTAASPQSQNVTPQNPATSQTAVSSSMNTASAADSANSLNLFAQGIPWLTFAKGSTTQGNTATAGSTPASISSASPNSPALYSPNLVDMLIVPVQGIKMGADAGVEMVSKAALGPVLGPAANKFYQDTEAQFSDPNLQQKVDQIAKQKDQKFQQNQAEQQAYWKTVTKGLEESNTKLLDNVNGVLGTQTNTISVPTH